MAGLCTCRNADGNLINNSNISNLIPIVSCTPICALVLAFISAPTPVLGLLRRYLDKNLQKATKLALKLFVKGQEHSQF